MSKARIGRLIALGKTGAARTGRPEPLLLLNAKTTHGDGSAPRVEPKSYEAQPAERTATA